MGSVRRRSGAQLADPALPSSARQRRSALLLRGSDSTVLSALEAPQEFRIDTKNSGRVLGLLFSLGTDPEFCLESPDGQLLSAIDRVPDRPIAEELYRDGRIFADNVLVELNIPAC